MTIATIISISGQAWARDEAGNLRELRVGDTLQEGETLVTSDNGRVELDFADSLDPTVIDGGQEVVMTPDLDAEQLVAAEEASAQDEDLEALLTAIDEGEGDLLEDLDATAAGAGGTGGEGGGHDFVRLARITENVNPLSYEYGLASLGGIPEVEGQAVEEPAPEDEPDSFPAVDTIDLDGDGDTVWESALPEGSGGGTLTTSGTFQIDTGTDLLALIEVQDAEGNWIAVGAEGSTIAGEYGTLTVNPDGSWTYTLTQSADHPVSGETGEADQLADTFAVRVTDDDGDVSAPATLAIAITDDGPAAANDADASIVEDTTTALTGDVLANDTLGADRPASVAFDDTQASYGTFTDNGDGTWSYSLDNSLAAVQALGEGDTLTETFSYTLTDADGDESTASLTITITGQDDGVTLTGLSAEGAEQTVAEANLPAGSSPEAAALTQSGTFSFTALDELGSLSVGGQSLSLADLQGLSASTPLTLTSDHGTLTLTGFSGDTAGGTLSYSYTLDSTVDNDSVADATDGGYLDSFAVNITDADGSSASTALDIRIVDDTPSAEDDPNASIAEDTTTALTGDVLANDTLGADRPASVAFDDTQASYGTFTDNGDGTWSYSLDNSLAAVQALDEGDTLTETFSYTLTDADGDESTASLTITIDGQTDGPPTIVVEDVDGSLTGADNNVVEATGNTVSGTATVTAEAGIATLTAGGQDITNASATNPVTLAGSYGTLVITGFDAATGVISYDYTEDGNAEDHSGGDDSIVDSFGLVVTDLAGETASDSLDIQVRDTEPEAGDDSASIAEDTTTALTGDVLANDTLGADRPASVAFDDTQASYGTFTDNGDGTWSYSLDNSLAAVQALGEGDTLTETFGYTLTDADGDESTASLTITITGQDDGVTLTGLSAEGAEQTVAEANLPAGSSPEAAALTQSGTFSFTALDELGSLSVGGQSLSLADLQGLSASTPLTLTSDHGTLTLTGFSGDAAGGTLSYSYTLDSTVDNDSVADATDGGYLDSFAVNITDADGSSANAALDIRIVDDTPSAEDDPNASIAEDTTTALTGDVLANDTLGADRPASVAFDDTQASYGTFTDNGDGTWSYSLDNSLAAVQALDEGDTLTETFSYTLTDADGDESTASLTITIDGQTDGPPTIVVEDVDGSLTGADNNVVEATGNTVSGTATVTAEAGIATLTAGGQDITNAGATNPVTLAGSYGTLVITGFDAATGVISYDYTEDGNAEDHSGGDDSIVDSFGLVVTDLAGETASDSLDIQVRDTEPEAGDDSASIAEDTTTALTGDVLANDTLGADRPASVAFDDTQASYGTFTDNGDGTWSYSLDNSLAAVQALGEGDTLTETFGYTLTDADGDESTASLTITITGQDDGVTLTGLSAEGAEQTVAEANLPAGSSPEAAALTQSGTFSFTALDELGSLSVGGQSLSLADLQGLSASTPLTLTSDHGTLTLTGFSGDAAGGTLSYSYTLDSTVDNDSVADATDGGYLDSFAVNITDADGSSASASLDIQILDDVPGIGPVRSAFMTHEVTGSLTDDIPLVFGADSDGTVTLSGSNDGTYWIHTGSGSSEVLTSDGNALLYRENADGSLDAYYAGDGGEVVVFSVKYNGDGTYTFHQDGPINGVANSTIEIGFSSGFGGGNIGGEVFFSSSDIIGEGGSVIVKGTPGDPSDSVNFNNNALGISQGSTIDDSSEVLVLEFYNGDGWSVSDDKGSLDEPDGGADKLTMNAVTLSFWGLDVSKGEVPTFSIFDENGSLISNASAEQNVDGTWTITSEDAFTTIHVSAQDSSGNGFGVSSALISTTIEGDSATIGLEATVTDADGDTSSVNWDFTSVPEGQLVEGTGGEDVLQGSEGRDSLYGGAGDDVLMGGVGADTFAWSFADDGGDQGTAGSPAIDLVTDFNLNEVSEGDVLRFNDLLPETGSDVGSYIHAIEDGEGNTLLHISSNGAFDDGFDANVADQIIALNGVSMGNLDSAAFLESLIADGQLDIE